MISRTVHSFIWSLFVLGEVHARGHADGFRGEESRYLEVHLDQESDGDPVVFIGRALPRTDSVQSRKAAAARARLAAIRFMLEARLSTSGLGRDLSPAVLNVVRDLAVGYFDETLRLGSAIEFVFRSEGGEEICELRVAGDFFRGLRIEPEMIVDEVIRRHEAGSASLIECLVAIELLGSESPRGEPVRRVVTAAASEVISDRAGWGDPRDEWLYRDAGVADRESWFGPWLATVRLLVTEGRLLPVRVALNYGQEDWASGTLSVRDALMERPLGALLAESLPIGCVPHELATLIRGRLAESGWVVTSSLVNGGSSATMLYDELPETVLRGDARREAVLAVIDRPRLLRQYLSGGEAVVHPEISPDSGVLSRARVLFDSGLDEDVADAIRILSDRAEIADLSVDEWSLLGASMFVLEEHSLARAFAMTAWKSDRRHAYAAGNLIRSCVRLGLAEDVRLVLRHVASDSSVEYNAWSRQQFEDARRWLAEVERNRTSSAD